LECIILAAFFFNISTIWIIISAGIIGVLYLALKERCRHKKNESKRNGGAE